MLLVKMYIILIEKNKSDSGRFLPDLCPSLTPSCQEKTRHNFFVIFTKQLSSTVFSALKDLGNTRFFLESQILS